MTQDETAVLAIMGASADQLATLIRMAETLGIGDEQFVGNLRRCREVVLREIRSSYAVMEASAAPARPALRLVAP